MKQQNLCNSGFILLEATVGVALFCGVVLMGLHAITRLAQHTAHIWLRHQLLCICASAVCNENLSNRTHGELRVINAAHIPMYNHSAVAWHEIMVTMGSETVRIYGARLTG